MRIFYNFPLLLLLAAACGARESESPPPLVMLEHGQLEAVIGRQHILCAEDFCPEGIGRVFALNLQKENKTSLCTGFLVASDLVLTNAHCLDGKASLQNACAALYFAFPNAAGKVQSARCDVIAYRGHKGIRNKDFALIRLDRHLPVKALTIDRRGITQEEVYPWVIDHIDEQHARILRLDCGAHYQYLRNSYRLSNCPIIHGNSGSPVLDQNFNLVGIVFASSHPAVKEPTTALPLRKKSHTAGRAYSLSYLDSVMGALF